MEIHPKPQVLAAPPPPLSPTPTTPRPADASPFPTTFVQANTSSFKQVVQMLTGSAETAAAAASAKSPAPAPASRHPGPKKPAFKLYERRSSLSAISPLLPAFLNSSSATAAFSPRNQPEVLSPSMLDFPALALSPVTPLIPDPFINRAASAEERAIAGRGFYLHPSPRTPRDGEPPRLLPLFPVTSPRGASSSPASSSTSDGNNC